MTATSTETTSSDRPLLARRALVTGATAGIGAAIATALGRDGAEVLVLGRDVQRGAGIVTSVREAGGQAAFVQADLGDPERLAELGDEVGDVDILVNNAGFSVWGATPEAPRGAGPVRHPSPPRPPPSAPPNPLRSPRSSRSSPRTKRATSRARRWPPTAAVRPS